MRWEVLSGLESALRVLKFDSGEKEFDVLTVNFDPRETPQMAAAKAEYLKRYGRPGAAAGWHFLTGPPASIDALTKAAGFQYQYDSKTGQFAHATAIMVLTPEGKIAQYYYGVEFAPKDLRLGLIQASENKIGTVVDQVLLYCYHYDPDTGKYGAIIRSRSAKAFGTRNHPACADLDRADPRHLVVCTRLADRCKAIHFFGSRPANDQNHLRGLL